MENLETDSPRKSLWAKLTQDEGASTFIRLARSRHVADLQLIFWASCIMMFCGLVFVIAYHNIIETTGVIGSAALITAIVGTGCGVLAWTYQTGGSRLGVVDLFSCEITTICRVVTITEMATHLVKTFSDPPSTPPKFDSREEYAPVFSANSKDLEVLEARVVEPVTEFYTYLKAMRDYLRILSAIERPREQIAEWQNAVQNVAYMVFLMLEAARASVERLIEFQPEQAENTITILLSELVVFGLLLECFEKKGCDVPGSNARLERLRLRKGNYLISVPEVYNRAKSCAKIAGNERERWQRSEALLGELNASYYQVFGQSLDPDYRVFPDELRLKAKA